MKRLLGVFLLLFIGSANATTIGFADVVLDYFDSGAGPLSGPYGGEYPGGIGFPVPVSTDVVLGDDGATADFLSLPTGSYVTVGFLDEVVFDGFGDDIFIQEVGGAGERAEVYVSSDDLTFSLLGVAVDNGLTSFDLGAINFTDIVSSVRIIGLDNGGGSPGFDVVNVQALPQSFTPAPVPEPVTLLLFCLGLVGVGISRRRAAQLN